MTTKLTLKAAQSIARAHNCRITRDASSGEYRLQFVGMPAMDYFTTDLRDCLDTMHTEVMQAFHLHELIVTDTKQHVIGPRHHIAFSDRLANDQLHDLARREPGKPFCIVVGGKITAALEYEAPFVVRDGDGVVVMRCKDADTALHAMDDLASAHRGRTFIAEQCGLELDRAEVRS